MKLNKIVLAITLSVSATSAFATSSDCGCDKVTKSVFQADQARQDKLTAANSAAIKAETDRAWKEEQTQYALIQTKYTEAAGKALEGQVANKVDKSVFQADQARQDKATSDLNGKVEGYATQGAAAYTEIKGQISAGTEAQSQRDAGQDEHINAVQGAAQAANEKGDALAVRADNIEKQAGVLDGRVGQTEVRLDGAEGAIRETNTQLAVTDSRSINNAVRLDGVETKNVEQDTRISKTETNVAKNTSEITKTQTTVKQQGEVINNHETRISVNEQNISAVGNDFYSYQQTNNAAVANTLSESKSYTNQKFGELKTKVDSNSREIQENKKEARRGISAAMAMTNIPQVIGQTVYLGAAVGSYAGESAIAVGGGWNVTPRLSTKMSVSYDGDNAGVGAGLAFGF